MDQWQQTGGSGISVRQLGLAADFPVSSIYYHFGSLEQLLLIAQDEAWNAAQDWCDSQIEALGQVDHSPHAFASFFAAVVDDWAHDQRRLAFAWREGQLLGARDERFRESATRWRTLWSEFWLRVSAPFGLVAQAALTERLFESESLLHMFRWRRTVDRAGLDEFSRGWCAWLCGTPMPAAPWRDFARAEAIRAFPPLPDRDETTARIAEAAGDVVTNAGVAALTHRAVAAQAGLTLGVVSHKFRTSAELLSAAFETIYARSIAPIGTKEISIPRHDRNAALDGIAAVIRRNTAGRGADELLVAVARDPSLQQFAAQLRYLRGQTSRGFLQAQVGDEREVTPLEGALYSGFVSGQIRAHFGDDDQEMHQRILTELEALFALIERR